MKVLHLSSRTRLGPGQWPPRPRVPSRPLRAFDITRNLPTEHGARQQALDLGLDPLAVDTPVYSAAERQVLDGRPAEEFFAAARIGVAHTDTAFTQRLTALYRGVLAPLSGPAASVLDLCSGSDSHLPTDVPIGQVVAHGVNEEELAANGAASSRFVQDLNARPSLPLASASLDAVLCCNGIQYLTKPEWVIAEVARVLRPGGAAVVAFSGNCWAERAAAGWLGRDAAGRLQLVARLLQGAGLHVLHTHSVEPDQPGGDPFLAVVAHKPPVPGAASAAGGAAGRDEALLLLASTDLDPVATARAYVGPALQELDLNVTRVTPLTLERWRDSYAALVEDAVELGVPRSAIPALPADANPDQIRAARDHLTAMMESFLSAGL
ncbi:hypothetical protein GPECTOR_30g166 [Gonium pectorale]|uniref:Methyltransferase type 11 domain-containing protein n=1 Tax=Gonium pectorale TaxID=33097 RepID=A0A150GDZ0_GONPE|nr:hypothetical protein GPECTOR_30g166 [Gonium pectorale]|eukprot:KXZ48071.1 hypothetical protein GPECTOR_30g166 [Gonium pectorale]